MCALARPEDGLELGDTALASNADDLGGSGNKRRLSRGGDVERETRRCTIPSCHVSRAAVCDP